MTTLPQDQEHEAGTYEDLRSLTNRLVWTVNLQVQRVREVFATAPPASFALRPVSDAEFLVISLYRFLAAARQIDRLTGGSLAQPIAEFDAALPNLRAARNVVAHIDEYLTGDGRDRSVTVGQLVAHLFDDERLDFAGFELDLRAALSATENVFAAIRENPPTSLTKAVARAQRQPP